MASTNRSISTGAFVAALLIAATTNVLSQPAATSDTSAIAARFASLQQAIMAHDTLSIGDYYTTDAISLLQNQPVRRGRNAIIQRWSKVLRSPIQIRVLHPEINMSPSMTDAFQFGSFEIHSADTANVLLASGKVMFLWRKDAGIWRIALEMDNFNQTSSPKN